MGNPLAFRRSLQEARRAGVSRDSFSAPHFCRLQPTRRAESLAFRRGRLKVSLWGWVKPPAFRRRLQEARAQREAGGLGGVSQCGRAWRVVRIGSEHLASVDFSRPISPRLQARVSHFSLVSSVIDKVGNGSLLCWLVSQPQHEAVVVPCRSPNARPPAARIPLGTGR